MKKFLLKNIVLAVILVLTFISSIFLIYLIWGKSHTIKVSMNEIAEKENTVKSINSARNPNSVEESERLIKADTEGVTRKKDQVYRHFGQPYRPALLKFISNIGSKGELKTDLPLDPSLVAKPKPKVDVEEEPEDDDEEVAETEPAEPAGPTDEEKAVFNPATNLVVLSYDEDALRAMLAELYKDLQQESSSDDSFVIPDTVQSEREQLFAQFFDKIIDAPEAVDPSRAEAFRKAAAAKFAHAFALFREEVQELTLETVTDRVAHELFLDALGLPRLMRQRDCKNYVDSIYQKYLSSDLIPGLPADDSVEKERLVQSFIYGKKINRLALPVPDMVIPILRNFQIKEDLFRRMKDSGISSLNSMEAGVFYGVSIDNDTEGPILVFTYTLEMNASMDAIDAFINSLQGAYKSDRVYVVKDIKLSAPYDDLVNANAIVGGHMDDDSSTTTRRTTTTTVANQTLPPGAPPVDGAFVNQQPAQTAATVVRSEYELTDPHNPEYGKTLIGGTRDAIKCTMVVNYLLYRAENITPQ